MMFYSIVKDEGTPQDKKFVTAVQIATPSATLQMSGDEKSRVKDAENSAASLMIRALQQHKYVWQLWPPKVLVVSLC